MDWVSATYNRFDSLAMAADRGLGIMVETCEMWLAGHARDTLPVPDGMGRGDRAKDVVPRRGGF